MNGKNFTIVANGWDYPAGKSLRVEEMITDRVTGEQSSDTINVVTK